MSGLGEHSWHCYGELAMTSMNRPFSNEAPRSLKGAQTPHPRPAFPLLSPQGTKLRTLSNSSVASAQRN